ncbi:Holliday junction resolvase RuvX [Gilliamella sp. B14384G15]|uniref:Holliday junction resolvase RuvX n=1 Tax=unclassified Gilliamella TaxID=2685620 RepID=UPI0018DBFD27|nr:MULTISPECIES: Holliday junction resolvase RuvX [unclassified Gilliamella]MBI0031848.1 Holliday junction resolvase RuvX [Gilliamella sp. B14384G15]MBI0059213.1 Holliday junction resolvase RuvX [Gilliamella sp. B14384G12]
MATVIAFDFGTFSIGAAIGQDVTRTASPLCSFKARDGIPNWQSIEKILNEWQPDLLVVGLPLNMDGTEQPLTARARKFANRLHGRFGYQVQLQDERLSTVEAKSRIFASCGYRALEKGHVDATSAVIILESWFENN